MIKALSQFDPKYIPAGICPPGAEHTIFMSEDVKIGENVYIGPFTQLIGRVVLGNDVIIMGNCVLDASQRLILVGGGTKIDPFVHFISKDSGIVVGKNCEFYSGCRLEDSCCGDDCKIGAHVKRTVMENRVVAKYSDTNLLDGVIEDDANISAGTTFYNFSGTEKKKTLVGSGSFIGGKIIAPRRIGNNVYMVAGLILREDIPDNTYVDPTGAFRPNEMQNDGSGHWVRIKS